LYESTKQKPVTNATGFLRTGFLVLAQMMDAGVSREFRQLRLRLNGFRLAAYQPSVLARGIIFQVAARHGMRFEFGVEFLRFCEGHIQKDVLFGLHDVAPYLMNDCIFAQRAFWVIHRAGDLPLDIRPIVGVHPKTEHQVGK
jgi:hypothetical protein